MTTSKLDSVLEEVKALTSEDQEKVREVLESLRAQSKPKMTIAEVEQKMFEDGLLTRIPSPITDSTRFRNRRLIEVESKPLSETIIEERR
jgi:hypothetical protein